MAGQEWHLEGRYVEYCSCDYGCPCESMAAPTQGSCDGVVAFDVEKGHCGDVDLGGTRFAATFYFPRAIHHGGGHMNPILDEKTNQAQRDALFYILSGEDQPAGTMFRIFSIIIETVHDPLFLPIDFQWDLEKRTARVDVPGIVRAESVPIRNPVTDEEHQISTVLPEGWVFHEAEGAAGTMKGTGAIKFDHAGRHSSLAHFAFNQNGMARTFAEHRSLFG